MPKTPMQRARSFLCWLAKEDLQAGGPSGGWFVVFNGMITLSDQCQERLAELIAEAQDEVREGFMRKPGKKEPHFTDPE